MPSRRRCRSAPVRKGYLFKGNTLAELAKSAGIDAAGLEETVREYNVGAERGEDRQFGRGTTSFNRYLADPENKPNPCVAPIGKGPYYAVKVIMGDLGTFDGIKTDAVGQVLKDNGDIVPGLYAVGNDRASIMGGNYPGRGHHAGAEHDLRLHHRPPVAGTWARPSRCCAAATATRAGVRHVA